MQIKWTLHDVHMLRVALSIPGGNTVQKLTDDLNELEAYRDERRWRVIGEEWPEPGKLCQVAVGDKVDNFLYVAGQDLFDAPDSHSPTGVPPLPTCQRRKADA